MVWEEGKGEDGLFGGFSYGFSIYSLLLIKNIQKHGEDNKLLKEINIYIYICIHTQKDHSRCFPLYVSSFSGVSSFSLYFSSLLFKLFPLLYFLLLYFWAFFFFLLPYSNSWFIMHLFRYSSIYYFIHFKPFSPCSFVNILPSPSWSPQKIWARPLPSLPSTTAFCAHFCNLSSHGAENSWCLRAPYLDPAELQWAVCVCVLVTQSCPNSLWL